MSEFGTVQYPLLFTYDEKISGNGYIARVVAHGRALMTQEAEGFWMYGVNPGGLAAGGSGMLEARVAFRDAFMKVVFDYAAEAGSFGEFRDLVGEFFDDVNEPTLAAWDAAVELVRAGKVDIEGLKKVRADSPRMVEVTLLDKPSANDNVLEPAAQIAA